MSASFSNQLKAEPNLTPLLDLVLQLVMFFMLLINFSKDDYNAAIRLPVAGSARPIDDPSPYDDRIVLHLDRNGRLLVRGDVGQQQGLDFAAASREIRLQGELARLNVRAATGKPIPFGAPLPTMLVLRADRATPFGVIFRLVEECQRNGFVNYSLKVMTRPGGSQG